ncbi:MAG: hypothetical protein AB7F86_19870 [Bdellovibrionales bacterium]
MSAKSLNSTLLKEFLTKASNSLKGDWLLVGGTLLPAVGIDIRSTVDIDLIGLSASGNQDSLELMELAESIGLPVDSINQAAAYFLKKVGHTKKDLILLRKGKSANIYRPSVELYWRLKLGRLSETDALDCQHYLQYASGQGDEIDFKKLTKSIRESLKALSPEAQQRAHALLKQVS